MHCFSPEITTSKAKCRTHEILQKKLVEEERAHAALVYDGDICVAWCQFGSPQELPNINHREEVESRMTMPAWRVTCIYVDKDYSFLYNGTKDIFEKAGFHYEGN